MTLGTMRVVGAPLTSKTPPVRRWALAILAAGTSLLVVSTGCAKTSTDDGGAAPAPAEPTNACSGCTLADQCLPLFGGCAGRDCLACAQCNPSGCDGCCAGGRCEGGDADDACGRAGAACKACTPPSTCREGRCLGLQGERCRLKRGDEGQVLKDETEEEFACAEGLTCVSDYAFISFFGALVSFPGTCRAPCGECGAGLQCASVRPFCMQEVTDASRWFVMLHHGSVRDEDAWDEGTDPPDLVGCIELAEVDACSQAEEPGESWFLELPRSFTTDELRRARITLWDDDGERPFDGCSDGDCARWRDVPRQEISSHEGAGREVALEPSETNWITRRFVHWPNGSVAIHLLLDERPTR